MLQMRLNNQSIKAAFLVILLGWISPAIAGPSYNCKANLTENERLICDRVGLGNLDQEIADRFFNLTSLLNRAAADIVRNDQRQFIKRRQRCGFSVRCTREIMMKRFHQLDNELQQQQAFRNGNEIDNEEQRPDDICGPGFTEINGKCIHNSDLEGRNENDNNRPGSQFAIAPGEYGIYVFANGADLRMDPRADRLLFTEQKSGNPNGKRLQSFILAAHQGGYIIRDKQSGLMLHADDNGDGQVSTRYQPNDGFTKVLITNANEGCFYIQTLASGRYWTWEQNSQVIITRRNPSGEASMFCFKGQ
ncbi:MAG: hypothetical protein DHS20C08_02300 [Rhodomicrobium sp.]|nr:MAG: hypothetical protein DHS20C08_02300 [Rhodomicrobium sp.]